MRAGEDGQDVETDSTKCKRTLNADRRSSSFTYLAVETGDVHVTDSIIL